MKKNMALLFSAVLLLAVFFDGCGRRKPDTMEDNTGTAAGTENDFMADEGETEYITDTEGISSQLSLGSAVEIPESFDGKLAETDAHEGLERVITEYCNIAEENYADVRYYYNYVDLNGDSRNEILALVLGQQVEGIDGNILLWLDDAEDGGFTLHSVKQEFRQVGAPVYISNHMTGGYRDLIIAERLNAVSDSEEVNEGNAGRTVDGDSTTLQKTAGLDDTTGENGAEPISMDQTYTLLVWTGEKYQDLEDGTILSNLTGYEGDAILTNNIESDLVNDNYHFLGEAM